MRAFWLCVKNQTPRNQTQQTFRAMFKQPVFEMFFSEKQHLFAFLPPPKKKNVLQQKEEGRNTLILQTKPITLKVKKSGSALLPPPFGSTQTSWPLGNFLRKPRHQGSRAQKKHESPKPLFHHVGLAVVLQVWSFCVSSRGGVEPFSKPKFWYGGPFSLPTFGKG